MERSVAVSPPQRALPLPLPQVHTDNPDGLFDILAPSFGGQPDLRMQRAGSSNILSFS